MSYPHVQHICNLARVGDILYLAHTQYGYQQLIGSIDRLQLDGVTIRRTSGAESVTFANGNKLHFATLRTLHKARGLSVWQVVTDDHNVLDNQDVRETLLPIFNHPQFGQLERYTVIG